MMLAPEIIAILTGVAFVAGFVDAIAGGGGLLTVPALAWAGLPPVTILAANKLQSSCGTAMACLTFARAGHLERRGTIWPVLAAMIGAGLGAVLVQRLDPSLFRALIPWLIMAAALYFLLSPALSDIPRHQRLGMLAFAPAAMLIGGYDGFFGPGAGAFYMLAITALLGLGVVRATALTKLLNLASNLASLALFALGGHIPWLLGGAMALGNMAGAQLGSRAAMRWGTQLIKPLLVTISLAMAAKLLLWP